MTVNLVICVIKIMMVVMHLVISLMIMMMVVGMIVTRITRGVIKEFVVLKTMPRCLVRRLQPMFIYFHFYNVAQVRSRAILFWPDITLTKSNSI
jgi:hypothetical protein